MASRESREESHGGQAQGLGDSNAHRRGGRDRRQEEERAASLPGSSGAGFT